MDKQNSMKRHSTLDPSELPDFYAMVCQGTCLEPAIPDGSCLSFTTTEPPKAGDLAVFHRRASAVQPGEHQALVKRMLTAKPVPCFHEEWDGVQPAYIAEMDNPRSRLVFPAADIISIHKCLGITPSSVKRLKVSDEELRALHRARVTQPMKAAAGAGAPRSARIAVGVPPRGSSYPVMNRLPKHHAVLPIGPRTDGAPFFRGAEFAVIDTADREPAEDGLFLVEYGTADSYRHSLRIVAPRRFRNGHGMSIDPEAGECWMHSSPGAPRSSAERDAMLEAARRNCPEGRVPLMPHFLTEGPITVDGLRKLIRGRVVGTFGPTIIREAVR
jgi:hypothetical protein